MKLQVLISCMHKKDFSIVVSTNIQTDAVVINQCDEDKVNEYTFTNKKGCECKVIFVNTTERGLSRSRNMALGYATSDLCLICDDDEELDDDYEAIIEKTYEKIPHADIIAFNIKRPRKKIYETSHKLGFFDALKVSSIHMTFRRKSIIDHNICFDTMLGSGSGNGGGEDTRFMRDCYENRLIIWCSSSFIGSLKNTSESVWFKGYNEQFFVNSGWVTRRVFGDFLSVLKLLHFAVVHWKDYKESISFLRALKYSFKGWGEKR